MKITKVFAIAALFSLAAVGSAFAAASTESTFSDNGTGTVGAPTVGVKPSKNVTVYYLSGTQLGTTAGWVSYSISASHGSGTKTFASSSGDTKLFMMDGTYGHPPGAPATGSSAAFGSGWTSL